MKYMRLNMKSPFRNSVALFAFAGLLAFSACKKDQTTWDGELTSTVDNNFADSEFNSIRNMVDTEGTSDSSIYGKVSGTTGLFCPTSVTNVTVTSATTANLTIDFGTGSNCLDGRLRSGKIHAAFNGKWKDAGSTVVITPENYRVSGYSFAFTSTVTVNGRDGNGDLNWTTVTDNAVLTSTSGSTIMWDATRTTTWIEGEGSLDPSTYAYEVTGTSEGTARNSLHFVANIDQPLRVELSCGNIVSGVWSITPDGREKRIIDYGGPGCDNQATLTVGSYTTAVTLP
jgi:hypothetical protein